MLPSTRMRDFLGTPGTGLRVALAIALVCLGGASGFFAAHLMHARSARALREAASSPPAAAMPGQAVVQDQPPHDGQPPAPRTIPVSLPNITLPDADGVRHSLSDWKGRPLLINFWATWCEPCRREIPLLKRLRHENAGDGIEIIGIAVDFRDAVQRYAHEMGIGYPVLIGEQDGLDAIAAFGMDPVFPFTVFADRQGRIVTLKVGELHPDEARFILGKMRDVDRGRVELAAARKQIADGIAALAAQRAQPEPAGTAGHHSR